MPSTAFRRTYALSVGFKMKPLRITIYLMNHIFQTSVLVKVGPSPSKKNCVICFIERPLKTIKSVFYLVLKGLFVLKIFKFLS